MTFDSLTFARRLKSAGFSEAQAEALADANRDLVVLDFASKADIATVRTDMSAMKQELQTAIEHQTLRLTVRFGIMLAAGLSLMTAILGAMMRFH